ncbi:hypothetical protein [Marinobacter sp. SS13-12]|uniref:hypothetical protein n=1 Tax=Marinobacter sp. SS13-12 TaxID=3050451 RepID=UPI002554BC91|nr:hypothetical protein [Marinobacter sp. SS13-12]MDK8463853.1 hypothetical protein [Marinobacter sp. SS13-12]
MRFRIFTKSDWEEPPRIRHQFAKMLKENGHEVIFYQKPSYCVSESLVGAEHNISIVRTASLIHHQLRVSGALSFFNEIVERKSIKASLDNCSDSDIIVNFNYDYYFLRSIFPNNKIITIINDDFVAQARFFGGRYAESALRKTCSISDEVLCVSTPLCEQVERWCKPRLFLPWTTKEYEEPRETCRDAVVLWAHINDRVDFDLIQIIALKRPNVEFHLVGPVDVNIANEVNALVDSNDNIFLLPSASLDEINFDKYFSSIIPYRKGRKGVEAVSASNKTFQLLSKGMPLIVSGMPNFIDSDVIFKTEYVDDFVKALDECRNDFFKMQGSIEEIVSANTSIQRFREIESILTN